MSILDWHDAECSVCDGFLGKKAHNTNIRLVCDECEQLSRAERRYKEGSEGRYGPSFDEAREIVIERDNHECQVCGKHESEVHSLDCHHIEGGVSTPENLVMLCRYCHPGVENGYIDLPEEHQID